MDQALPQFGLRLLDLVGELVLQTSHPLGAHRASDEAQQHHQVTQPEDDPQQQEDLVGDVPPGVAVVLTCDEVAEADGGQGDEGEVDPLAECPGLEDAEDSRGEDDEDDETGDEVQEDVADETQTALILVPLVAVVSPEELQHKRSAHLFLF